MLLNPKDITIAIPTFHRTEFLENAINSALTQSIPVAVHVYDDAAVPQVLDSAGITPNVTTMPAELPFRGSEGSDLDKNTKSDAMTPTEAFVHRHFGTRVVYHRNASTLGQFGNMNAIIACTTTPWLSILHDDDMLAPDFVERILEIAPDNPDQTRLLFGGSVFMNNQSVPFHSIGEFPNAHTTARVTSETPSWRNVPLEEFAARNLFCFPGQLIHVETARKLGGFPVSSAYAGDWALWFKLALAGGAVQLRAPLGFYRTHEQTARYTTRAARSGRRKACSNMQAKNNFALLRARGHPSAVYDRVATLEMSPPMYRELFLNAPSMENWMLRYNRKLLGVAPARSAKMELLRFVVRSFGNTGVRWISRLYAVAQKLGLKPPQGF